MVPLLQCIILGVCLVFSYLIVDVSEATSTALQSCSRLYQSAHVDDFFKYLAMRAPTDTYSTAGVVHGVVVIHGQTHVLV